MKSISYLLINKRMNEIIIQETHNVICETERDYAIDHPTFGIMAIGKQKAPLRSLMVLDEVENGGDLVSYWSSSTLEEAVGYANNFILNKEEV